MEAKQLNATSLGHSYLVEGPGKTPEWAVRGVLQGVHHVLHTAAANETGSALILLTMTVGPDNDEIEFWVNPDQEIE